MRSLARLATVALLALSATACRQALNVSVNP
jgi:hypothetical protein